ncbi:MAG: segregation and condensation protein A, partial [Sphingopyxis sp.]
MQQPGATGAPVAEPPHRPAAGADWPAELAEAHRAPEPLVADGAHGARLRVDLDGWEGPLDLLLALARTQKVDLKAISILQLVEQYLDFIDQAHNISVESAADYLVMAAWLAMRKAALRLPRAEQEEPSPEELAMQLQWRLQRLS